MKIKLLIILLLSVHMLIAQEEEEFSRFRGMAAIGMNATQIDGDMIKGFNHFGLNSAVGVYIMYTPNWSTLIEIVYSQKGSRFPQKNTFTFLPALNDQAYFERIIDLDYIEIPVMVNYHDGKLAAFNLGFSIARLINYKERVRFASTPGVLEDITDTRSALYSDWEFAVTGGITFFIKERYGIDFRFSRTLVKLGDFPENDTSDGNNVTAVVKGHFNTVVGIRFMYVFNR